MSSAQDVVIVGAGKLGALVHDCLTGDDRWRCTAFHDEGRAGEKLHGLPVRGLTVQELPAGTRAIMAVGDPVSRKGLVERLAPNALEWQSFVDRRSLVGAGASLGPGTVVLNFATIASSVRTDAFCYFFSYSRAGSGSAIGAYTTLTGGASVGESVVGSMCVLGLNSVCLEGTVVGDGVTVAPMAFVRHLDVPPGTLVAGNPARVFRRHKDRTRKTL